MRHSAGTAGLVGVLLSACVATRHVQPSAYRIGNESDAIRELRTTLKTLLSATSLVVSVLGEDDRKMHDATLTGAHLAKLQVLLRDTSLEYSPNDTKYVSQDYAIAGLDVITIGMPDAATVSLHAGILVILPSRNTFRVTPVEREVSTPLRDILEEVMAKERPTMPSSVPLTRGTPPAGQEPRLGSRSAHG